MLALKTLYQGFRDPQTLAKLATMIADEAQQLIEPIKIMEVCGGHTHTIMKYGLKQLLPNNIEFIHGPGCPVCIMPKERIDHAAILACLPNVILVTLGDMIRVPGSKGSLAEFRSQGHDIRPIYDPLDTLNIAINNPDKTIIFFAIGFETSTPMTAVLLEQAEKRGINNLLFYINHVLVPPAIDAVMADPDVQVNAFIGPSHVSVISGSKVYRPCVEKYQTPLVVSGFEPVDVMESILRIVRQKVQGVAELDVQYSRAVTEEGNLAAQNKNQETFVVRESFRWRGLGPIAKSALALNPKYSHRDAEIIYRDQLPNTEIDDHKACQCGDVLRGIVKPKDCKVFGRGCSPQTPLGSCMVSSEGACNAYYRYNGVS
ncbi:hydrogenase formation protein HypD [Shewanella nanhaiensis]|uniref:Hydrogenase maturation factor n=1 Tax=Shewanella nanhaiensis TaxID=2864872 RepID=A0ABS7E5H4_9GAMM|nr:hydrogenase formation protein HypD [Shewanella nanhaiensis]MBW8184934.1 hydrogenase formation protein HypD [Shewanella nanhaiensis]